MMMSGPLLVSMAEAIRGFRSFMLIRSTVTSTPASLPNSAASRLNSRSEAGTKRTHSRMFSFVPFGKLGAFCAATISGRPPTAAAPVATPATLRKVRRSSIVTPGFAMDHPRRTGRVPPRVRERLTRGPLHILTRAHTETEAITTPPMGSVKRSSGTRNEMSRREEDRAAGTFDDRPGARRCAAERRLLLEPVRDPTSGQVVGGQLHRDLVAGQDPDAVHSHLAGHVGQDLVAIVHLHPEHRVGQRLDHLALHLDCVFLAHGFSAFHRRLGRTPNVDPGRDDNRCSEHDGSRDLDSPSRTGRSRHPRAYHASDACPHRLLGWERTASSLEDDLHELGHLLVALVFRLDADDPAGLEVGQRERLFHEAR